MFDIGPVGAGIAGDLHDLAAIDAFEFDVSAADIGHAPFLIGVADVGPLMDIGAVASGGGFDIEAFAAVFVDDLVLIFIDEPNAPGLPIAAVIDPELDILAVAGPIAHGRTADVDEFAAAFIFEFVPFGGIERGREAGIAAACAHTILAFVIRVDSDSNGSALTVHAVAFVFTDAGVAFARAIIVATYAVDAKGARALVSGGARSAEVQCAAAAAASAITHAAARVPAHAAAAARAYAAARRCAASGGILFIDEDGFVNIDEGRASARKHERGENGAMQNGERSAIWRFGGESHGKTPNAGTNGLGRRDCRGRQSMGASEE